MPLAAFPKCYLDALSVDRTMTVDAWIELAADLEIDGLEFYWGFTPHEDREELDRIREKAAEEGLSIPMMCYSPDFTWPDPEERDREVREQKRAVRTTARLGGDYCRVLSGQRRPEVGREDGLAWAAESIRRVLPVAEEEGVTLILENHYKDGYWRYPEFAQQRDLFLDLLERIGTHEHLGVNYDPSNAIIAGDDPIELLEAVKDRVVTMHASDRYFSDGDLEDLRAVDADPHAGYADVLEHGVVGEGLNDYDEIFSILREAGFDGWVSIEDGEDPERGLEDLRASARFLREKMAAHGLE